MKPFSKLLWTLLDNETSDSLTSAVRHQISHKNFDFFRGVAVIQCFRVKFFNITMIDFIFLSVSGKCNLFWNKIVYTNCGVQSRHWNRNNFEWWRLLKGKSGQFTISNNSETPVFNACTDRCKVLVRPLVMWRYKSTPSRDFMHWLNLWLKHQQREHSAKELSLEWIDLSPIYIRSFVPSTNTLTNRSADRNWCVRKLDLNVFFAWNIPK